MQTLRLGGLAAALGLAIGCGGAATEPTDMSKQEAPTENQLVTQYKACWDAFNAHDQAKFADCFTEDLDAAGVDSPMSAANRDEFFAKMLGPYWAAFPDMKGYPQLVVVNGSKIISIELINATNTGSFNGMPATNKKVGYYMGHVFEANADNKITKMRGYFDPATLMGQLGHMPLPHRPAVDASTALAEPVVVEVTGSETETANLAKFNSAIDAFNAHDYDKLFADFADNCSISDYSMPQDFSTKAEFQGMHEKFMTAFPDMKINTVEKFAAGDYIVHIGSMSGTNSGTLPEFGIQEPTNKSVTMNSLDIFTVENGKVVRMQTFANGMVIPMQLGLIPAPGEAPAPAPAN